MEKRRWCIRQNHFHPTQEHFLDTQKKVRWFYSSFSHLTITFCCRSNGWWWFQVIRDIQGSWGKYVIEVRNPIWCPRGSSLLNLFSLFLPFSFSCGQEVDRLTSHSRSNILDFSVFDALFVSWVSIMGLLFPHFLSRFYSFFQVICCYYIWPFPLSEWNSFSSWHFIHTTHMVSVWKTCILLSTWNSCL